MSLCLIDLRENGEALRIARAVRAQHPQGGGHRRRRSRRGRPRRPTRSAPASSTCCRGRRRRAISKRCIANAREQAVAGAHAAPLRRSDATPYGIVGTSPAMRLVMDLVQRAAAGRCGILICGERGTGREMIARAIHAHGANRNAPFVKVDCSGPTPEDIELQLFGVINKRSGSGAPERRSLERIGEHCRLRDAAGGILFLENVTELPGARAGAPGAGAARPRSVRRRRPRAGSARHAARRVGGRIDRRRARRGAASPRSARAAVADSRRRAGACVSGAKTFRCSPRTS